MKCPECGTNNAQQLLVSYLCPNQKCKNYDSKQELKSFFIQLSKKPNRNAHKQMELAIEQMRNSNEQEILQDRARMKREKIRHASLMQMNKMKQELAELEKPEDPLDAALKEYLQRKLQIGMIKDLGATD